MRLDVYMPVMCPLCRLEKRGIEWITALQQIAGESDERYHQRVSTILGYDFEGEFDERYYHAIDNIYERRTGESDITYSLRVSIFRWSWYGLVSVLVRFGADL